MGFIAKPPAMLLSDLDYITLAVKMNYYL